MKEVKCPVEGCTREPMVPTRMKLHIMHAHDKSPSQAKALLEGAAAVSLSESPPEKDPPQESQATVAELEEKLAKAEGRTMNDFTPVEKANFVIAWGKELSPEDKAVFASAVGISIATAPAAEVAEVEGEPSIIKGKTDKPGYRFLEMLGLSVKED